MAVTSITSGPRGVRTRISSRTRAPNSASITGEPMLILPSSHAYFVHAHDGDGHPLVASSQVGDGGTDRHLLAPGLGSGAHNPQMYGMPVEEAQAAVNLAQSALAFHVVRALAAVAVAAAQGTASTTRCRSARRSLSRRSHLDRSKYGQPFFAAQTFE